MLVLTRRKDESLVIDNQIIIKILAVEGEKVKIGITAPRNISILREELWQAMNQPRQVEEQAASELAPTGSDDSPEFSASDTVNHNGLEDHD